MSPSLLAALGAACSLAGACQPVKEGPPGAPARLSSLVPQPGGVPSPSPAPSPAPSPSPSPSPEPLLASCKPAPPIEVWLATEATADAARTRVTVWARPDVDGPVTLRLDVPAWARVQGDATARWPAVRTGDTVRMDRVIVAPTGRSGELVAVAEVVVDELAQPATATAQARIGPPGAEVTTPPRVVTLPGGARVAVAR